MIDIFLTKNILISSSENNIIIYNTDETDQSSFKIKTEKWNQSLLMYNDDLIVGCGDGQILIYEMENWNLKQALNVH